MIQKASPRKSEGPGDSRRCVTAEMQTFESQQVVVGPIAMGQAVTRRGASLVK
jgi:hypothetical protein